MTTQPRFTPPPPLARPPQILVVDDDPINVRLIEGFLSAEGYRILGALDGAQALQLLSTEEIDLVILDVRMPRMNGFEVCKRIREDPKRARLPIIFLTAEMQDLDSEMQGFDAGADEYLHKPIQRRALVARVRSLLRLADAERDRRLSNQLAQADKFAAIGQIAAGVAHEINNPMSFILSNLSSLKGYVADIQAVIDAYRNGTETGRAMEEKLALTESLSDIHALIGETVEGGNRVRDIVRELKTFSRADDAKLEPVDLAEVAASTLLLTEREISLRAKVIRELVPAPIQRAPRAKLHQLTLNLVVNAFQALDAAATHRNQIRVCTGTDGERSFLQVSDTGSGIPLELQSRIFDPFFTTKPVGIGSGLGLSVCTAVAQEMGGRILLDSTPGKGSTFTVQVPVQGAPD